MNHSRPIRLMAPLLFLLCGMPSRAQSPESSLDDPIPDRDLRIGNEFAQLCSWQKQPCGLEESKCNDIHFPESGTKILSLKKVTFRIAMERITKLHPGYTWIIRNGVINLEPLHRNGPDLLSRKLDGVSIHGIKSNIAMYSLLEQAGMLPGVIMGPGSGLAAFNAITLELKNVTLREALNAVAKADHLHWRFAPDKFPYTFSDNKSADARVCFSITH